MGDDLGDEWWTREGNSVNHGNNREEDQKENKFSDTEIDVSEKEEEIEEERSQAGQQQTQTKTGRKRKSLTDKPAKAKKKKTEQKERIVVQDKDKDEADKTSNPKKRRRKKKTITAVLASSEPKPGCPADLQNLITQYFSDKRSVIELEELKLKDSNFLASNDLTHSLSSYLKEICPKWAKKQKQHTEKGSLALLIVCSSALRTIELIKQLTTFKGDAKVLKLFAKHIKVEEQVKLLQKGVTHIGVGTPGRLQCLIEREGLKMQNLSYLVLDWNWRDQKFRRMADIPELKVDLLKLLETGVLKGCRDGQVKIGLF